MREIKFRIWDKKYSRWFQGGTDNASIIFRTDAISLFGEVIVMGEILRDQNTDKMISVERINDLVALQFTGLKDKNGKEIYDGDILLPPNPARKHIYNYEVMWIDSASRFCVMSKRKAKGTFIKQGLPRVADLCEVIGNIYESKELLNGN